MMLNEQILTGQNARPRKPFRLLRFFSLGSLFGILAVTACLFWVYRDLSERNLIAHEGRANADMTRAFANQTWSRYRSYVVDSSGRSRESLLADPLVGKFDRDVRSMMRGLQVAKIKVYNVDGITVFSTDAKQIGEDKSSNVGFRAALTGDVVSNITYREKFDAFESQIAQRNLIASYVPVRTERGGAIEGVFEVYSDVTEMHSAQVRAQWQVAFVVVALLATLYLFLFLIVRKADRIIAAQESERARKEAEIRHQAYHDSLTGLPNRAYFAERLDETIALASRHGFACALMYVDLDRFKIVNDSLGHQAGDELLRVAASRLSECVRESDLLFRTGGDEFTVILSQIAVPEDAAYVARRIEKALSAPVTMHEHELRIGATIGIAVFPGDGDDAEALIRNADAAMYSAKSVGRGGHAFYRAEMNERASVRLNLELALQKGFRDGEFMLYYQPRMAADSRRIVAVEALLRWTSPSRGVVLPRDFIGVIEDIGLMPMVGEWVLRTACQQVAQWREQGLPALRVSVNVSPIQFQSSTFVATVERVLVETGVPASSLELELTENLLIADVAKAGATIAALKSLGLRISIDDFGTGYSSLNYLRHFHVDYLKIDRSFVTEIPDNARDSAVAIAIIDLAKALGIAVVAEGVETQAQAAFFTRANCSELQGYLFSRPVPVDQLDRMLAAPVMPVDAGREVAGSAAEIRVS